MRAINLQTEYLINPRAIDIKQPRLSWNIVDGKKQTAFQLLAKKNNEVVLDSGVNYTNQTFLHYEKPLNSRDVISWQVKVWDEQNNESQWSNSASFEMGLLKKSDWKAKWINPELDFNSDERQPASYFLKEFLVEEVGKSRLYITSHGIYTVAINGQRIEEFILAPGTSQYNKRLQYQTYDVSPYLNKGNNKIEITLGDGWWRGDTGFEGKRNTFGKDIALLCQMEIDNKIVLISDESWVASQDGPIQINDLMQGETVDARKEKISSWHGVKVENFGYTNLVCSNSFNVSEMEYFKGRLINTPNNETVIDFGQNIAGYVQFEIEAKEGQKIEIQHGECLDQFGNFTVKNFQAPNHNVDQKITYTCKNGLNRYKPTMTIFGFQYIKITTDIPVKVEQFKAIAVYSEMEQTSFFECGHSGTNKLFDNTIWSMKGNFLEVPTDCPTRERSGFTGDAQVFVNTGMYLMNSYPIFRKFLAEVCANQQDNGCIASVAPFMEIIGTEGASGWGDAITLIPYRMFLRYQDKKIIYENYDAIKKWLDFSLNRAKNHNTNRKKKNIEEYSDYLVDTGFHWGEWLEPDWNGYGDYAEFLKHTNTYGVPELATSHLSFGCHIASILAKELGLSKDCEYYALMRENTLKAYYESCTEDGLITSGRQCEYIRAIMFDMLSEKEKQIAADKLNELVISNDYHLKTGFLTTYELLNSLTDFGYSDTAYKLMFQDSYPGWQYQLKFGATTIWENWKAMEKDRAPLDSMNHYSYGTFCGWLMSRAAGIIVENNQIIIHPYPNKLMGYVKASYNSPIGKIKSSWEFKDGNLFMEVEIPSNCTAIIITPDNKEHRVESGLFNFKYKADNKEYKNE